jgi:gliding motility-associated-like protein
MRTIVSLSFFLLVSFCSFSQSCDCPATGTCFTCQGGITTFTLRYNGSTAQTITAGDNQGTVFSEVVNPNATFSFQGSLPNEKFIGSVVNLTVAGNANATISANCGSVFVGNIYGSFTVVGASSKEGGVLCCSASFTENIPPQIANCPSNVTVSIPSSACEVAGGWIPPTATDNCTLASFTSDHSPTDMLPVGVTTVTYTAVDLYNNSSTCSFDVTVKASAAPSVTNCPADITVHTFDEATSVTWDPPHAKAACGDLTFTSSYQPGVSFNIGSTSVTYEFKDGTGNKSVCSFNVNVVKDEPSFEPSKVITPNGDGINDTWSITNIEKFKDNTVLVVDRWGNRIYHGSAYDNSSVQWTGAGPNGSRVPVGTYFYTLEVRMKETTIRGSGFIEVIY